MSKPFILGINGSPHEDGVVADLLDMMIDGAASEGAETKTIHLYDLQVVPTPGHYSQHPSLETMHTMPEDDITALYPDILRADGLVFATPVYWANMSAVMKHFIEHLTPLENDGYRLQGKLGAVIAASKENEGGVEMAAMSVVIALTQMGFLLPPDSVLWYPSQWDDARSHHTEWAKEDAPRVGRNMVQLVTVLKDHPIDWGRLA